jgi:hypothetical protein
MTLPYAGCGGSEVASSIEVNESDAGPEVSTSNADSVSSAETHLNANARYTGGGTPFMVAQYERAAKIARTAIRTTAYQQCLYNTMSEPRSGFPGAYRYLPCGANEPNATASISSQRYWVLNALRTFNNNLEIDLDATADNPSAAYQGHGTYDTHSMTINKGFHESWPDWSWYSGIQPWNFQAPTPPHEYLHTQDYGHAEKSCVNNCGKSGCGWTTVCGGSGTPPASMTWTNTGWSEQEYCSWVHTGSDTQYYAQGEPSVPYIADSCVGLLLVESNRQCSGGVLRNSACGTGELRLLQSWTGDAETTQTSTTCGCYADPRHTVALRTSTGHYLTAWAGGGSNIRTRETDRIGSWQTFFAIENDSSPWTAHELVQLKSFSGSWVSGTSFDANGSSPTSLLIGHSSQPSYTPLLNGSAVALRSGSNYASDNGYDLQPVTTSTAGTNQTFTLVEYDRESTIAYLVSDHGRFVNVGTNNNIRNEVQSSSISNMDNSHNSNRRAAGFRIIDWNGAPLQSNDIVSIEAMKNDSWEYLTTPSASGIMSLANSVHNAERFVIRKVSGSTGAVILHNDVVSFRTSNNNYISALPSADNWAVTNAGTWEGPWQRFTLRLVHQHDRARPTW